MIANKICAACRKDSRKTRRLRQVEVGRWRWTGQLCSVSQTLKIEENQCQDMTLAKLESPFTCKGNHITWNQPQLPTNQHLNIKINRENFRVDYSLRLCIKGNVMPKTDLMAYSGDIYLRMLLSNALQFDIPSIRNSYSSGFCNNITSCMCADTTFYTELGIWAAVGPVISA
jgi:hypothetical protein